MLTTAALGGASTIAPWAACIPAARLLATTANFLAGANHANPRATSVAAEPRLQDTSTSNAMHPTISVAQLACRFHTSPTILLRTVVPAPGISRPPFVTSTRFLSTTDIHTIGTTITNTTITDTPVNTPYNTATPPTTTKTQFHHFLNDVHYASITLPLPDLKNSQDVAAAVAQCAEQGVRDHNHLKVLAEAAANHLPQMMPSQISQMAVDFARLGYFNVKFKTQLADEILTRLDDFDASDVANTAWAFGELQYYDCFLMPAILPFVQNNMDQFTATDLAKVVWAYGRLGYRDDALPEIMQQMVAKLDEDFCSKTLAEVVFTEALMGWADPELHSSISDHTVANIDEFDGESLGKIVYGLAASGCEDEELFGAAAERAMKIMDELAPKDLARIMWALSEMSYFHKELLAKLTTEILPTGMNKFGADELRIIITACNKLGCTGDSVAQAALQLQKMQNHDPQFNLRSE